MHILEFSQNMLRKTSASANYFIFAGSLQLAQYINKMSFCDNKSPAMLIQLIIQPVKLYTLQVKTEFTNIVAQH